MPRACGARLVALAGLALVGAGCIIPDRGIRAESDDDNPGAVRIIEAIVLPAELTAACDDLDATEADRRGCPQVPPATPQGLLPGGPYCACPGRDRNVLPELSLYAEDPDRLRDDPADTLYAVALLDLDPLTDAPQNYVAYPEHLFPGGAGEYIRDRAGYGDQTELRPSVGREDNGLWRFTFGKDRGAGTDLCNDDDGRTLSVGLHNLTIMVTDRPFFQPTRLDADGEPVIGADGQPELLRPQYGMPDLAVGATWAVANYVFECLNGVGTMDVDPDARCNCEAVDQ